MLENALLPFAL